AVAVAVDGIRVGPRKDRIGRPGAGGAEAQTAVRVAHHTALGANLRHPQGLRVVAVAAEDRCAGLERPLALLGRAGGPALIERRLIDRGGRRPGETERRLVLGAGAGGGAGVEGGGVGVLVAEVV